MIILLENKSQHLGTNQSLSQFIKFPLESRAFIDIDFTTQKKIK